MKNDAQGFHFTYVTPAGSNQMKVLLRLPEGGQPVIVFAATDGLGPRHEYHLSQFLEAMLHKREFVFLLDDEDPVESRVTIEGDDVQVIGSMALSMLSPLIGHYAFTWVPFDPHLPF